MIVLSSLIDSTNYFYYLPRRKVCNPKLIREVEDFANTLLYIVDKEV